MIKPKGVLPWRLDDNGIYCQEGAENRYIDNDGIQYHQDAEYIVHACNEHPKLKEQNKRLMRSVLGVKMRLKERFNNVEEGDVEFELIEDCEDALKILEQSND